MQGSTATTTCMELQEKEEQKDYNIQEIRLERTYR